MQDVLVSQDAIAASNSDRRKTFIRAAEVWVPDRSGTHLELADGMYGDCAAFGVASRSMVFGRGEGLPGRVWESGAPVVIPQLEGSYFRRTAAASAAGITGAIGIPVMAGDFLTGVLVIFCGSDDDHAGAIELWQAEASGNAEMTLVDGYYGTTGDAFEFVSRRTAFRRGVGLPGQVWESGRPIVLDDLGRSQQFIRAESAKRVGINRGLGIPCSVYDDRDCALVFLSALGTPIARRFEIWTPDRAAGALHRTDGFCEAQGRLGAADTAVIERGQGAVGHAWITGVPAVSSHAQADMGRLGDELKGAGLTTLIALPIVKRGRLQSFAVWYF